MPTQFPATIELSSLNGKNGFTINGLKFNDQGGRSVSRAGDINADGFEDIFMGAFKASTTTTDCGQSYVIFGGIEVGNSGVVDISDLNGKNGFLLSGITAFSYSGRSVANLGDVNADNITDLIIGAFGANPNGFQSGQSYVIFGGNDVGSSGLIELSNLNGHNGFILDGITGGDRSGCSVATIGDFNDDGIADFIIGADFASPNGVESGQSYVIFGGMSIGGSGLIELSNLNGRNGFKINGIAAYVHSGISVAAAGDINADGVADLIVGASHTNSEAFESGQSYVIFGGVSVGSSGTIELSSLDGKNGFIIKCNITRSYSGYSVALAGDINADGVADLVIGAPGGGVNHTYSGQSYVIFGGANIGESGVTELSELNGNNGFVINGIDADDYSGQSVASAGDINGDGMADLIIGAPGANPNGILSGQSYIVFGGACVGRTGVFELSDLNGRNGFKLNGIVNSASGISVSSAGDVDSDGVDDLIIGASYLSKSYVVLGDFINQLSLVNNQLSINQGQTIVFNQNNLNATSDYYPDGELQFIISDLQHGFFSFTSNPNVHITKFNQHNITEGQVQFVQDWSIYPPSYNVSAFTGRWVITTPETAKIDFGPLVLVNNALTINQGGKLLLNATNLLATDKNATDAQIIFNIDNIQNGWFQETVHSSISIRHFTQQQINDRQIEFVQDGTPNIPSYSVTVSDGIYTLPPSDGNIRFYELPNLKANVLTIQQGQTVILNSGNLQATDKYVPAPELVFLISALEHGYFSFVANKAPLIEFTQGSVDLKTVQFTHDGSRFSPSYNVSVRANRLATLPAAAHINWQPAASTPKQNTNKMLRYTLIGTLTAGGVLGSMLICYLGMGLLKNRRLNTTANDKEGAQKLFYQNVIIPVAKAVFKQIKITGFMNYISSEQMEAYVAEIATIIGELGRLGVNIDLQQIEPEQQAQLLAQITKQIKHHLNIQPNKCNSAWVTSFFKPQVTPEMIGKKTQIIVDSIHAALLGKDSAGIINLPTEVDFGDIIGQKPTGDKFTTGYVQMS